MNTAHLIHSPADITETVSEAQYHMLNLLEKNPTLSQRDLAAHLGFSLGKVNYCLNALIEKGLIKGENFIRNPKKSEYAYLLTPKGAKSKAVLTTRFLERKIAEYQALEKEIEGLKIQAGRKRPSNIPNKIS